MVTAPIDPPMGRRRTLMLAAPLNPPRVRSVRVKVILKPSWAMTTTSLPSRMRQSAGSPSRTQASRPLAWAATVSGKSSLCPPSLALKVMLTS